MGSYRLIYDLGNEAGTDGGWWLATAWLAGALAVAAFGYRRRLWQAWIGFVLLLFSAYFSAAPCWERQRLAAALQSGRFQVAEGVVRGYWVRRADKDLAGGESVVWENFTVDGVLFGYYRDHAQPGFRNAQTPPLQLRDGLPLRIAYLEDSGKTGSQPRILRLEVAEFSGAEDNTPPGGPSSSANLTARDLARITDKNPRRSD